MKRHLIIPFDFVIALILFTQCQQKQNKPIAIQPGQPLFEHYCARCHLANGIGGPSTEAGVNAVDIRQFSKSPAELVDIITLGFGKMPAFGDSISKDNITAIADYVASSIEKHVSASAPNTR